MSLHAIAQHMAAKGRGPDNQLVHMSGREVAGLQALAKAHGGSLTVNPHTGLVEAGFLDRMMPTLLGAGLMYATGGLGAGALTAGEIGLGVGGLQTARTGSIMEGIKAGLGAYGGAGLASGFAAAAPTGAEATPAAATTPPAAPTAPVTPTAPAPVTPDYTLQAPPSQTLNAGTGAPTLTPTPEAVGGFGPQNAMSNADRIAAAGDNASYANRISSAGNSGFMQGQSGIGNLSTKDALKYGAAALGSMADTSPKPVPGAEKYNGPLSKYRMSEDYKPYEPQQPNPYYMPQRYTYGMAAGGGVVEQMSNANSVGQNTGFPQADIHQGAYATPWQTPISRNVVTDSSDSGVDSFTGEPRGMAGGGITSLGHYSDGGQMLKGPGDGMSDSIPAQIGSKQPARLADGEFVVPADVVSHLGNGSSDAGAKQLYAMMDRIRKQRTGKKRQAPQVNPSKAMPA